MTCILLVEDNPMNRDMLSRRLVRKGYEVVLAEDGRQALDEARTKHPDIILMDLSLPVMDGWEATRLLTADTATASIPVIALSAHAMSNELQRAIDAGCVDCDTKPVEFPRLLGKIQSALALAENRDCSEQAQGV